jgi:hypothetical protein
MTLTVHPIPAYIMRNERDPVDTTFAPRCKTLWCLFLDREGHAWVSSEDNHGGNATPMDEYHKKTLAWSIGEAGDQRVVDSACLTAALADGGVLRALLGRVYQGHDIEWDGNNHVETLSDDAAQASDEIEMLLGETCSTRMRLRRGAPMIG